MSNHAVQAKSYSNKQLWQYTLKMMKKHHLRGSIEIVKNGHAQRVSLGYGYYSKRLKNGNTKLLYPVGSLQKMVTAAIITQLIYQNKDMKSHQSLTAEFVDKYRFASTSMVE